MEQEFILRMAWMLLLLVCGTEAKMEIISSKSDVMVGAEHVMLCKAGGEGRITWEKDGVEIDDEDMVSGVDETSSKLVIAAVTLQDAGRYACLCEFESGHSDDVTVTLFVYEGPSFGDTVSYHEFLEGANATVPCLVSGQPAVDVYWSKDQQEIVSYEGRRVRQLADHSLYIGRISRKDAGTYVCHGLIRGRTISQQLPISIVVNAAPVVLMKETVKKVMAGPETNVSLICLVDGHPKPNISWIMPVNLDPFRHQFNSDRSQLTILSVAREDFGDYICTGANKLAESSATFSLDVFELPKVFVTSEKQASLGQSVSVSCNVSGHPQPEIYWISKRSGRTLQDSTKDRVRVQNGTLVIDHVAPPDGGVYSCMAVSPNGNASRDVLIQTQPGPPQDLSVSPGPSSVLFTLKTPPVSGGAPVTSFALQWRQSPTEKWQEVTVPASAALTITSLKPYTSYTVRLAAMNAVGLGQFSNIQAVRTGGKREPDRPVLLADEMKVEDNTFSVPLKQADNGATPLSHFDVRYKQDKEGAEWKAKQLSPNAGVALIPELSYGTDYLLEVVAVNLNGSSMPARLNFTIPEQPAKPSRRMTKGTVVGIVMVLFLLVLLAVDAACCYTNRCGLLMFIAVKLFGQKVPGLKMAEEEDGTTNGDFKLNGVATPRGSVRNKATKDGGQLAEVTCDKAPLTKHEKAAPRRDTTTTEA